MKICWDNLEKLEYSHKTKNWYYKKRVTYIYKDSCTTCKEPFLTVKWRNSGYCCRKCVPSKYGIYNNRYGKHHTDETKKRISMSEKDKIVSKKTKQKQRVSRLNFIKENPEIAFKNSAKSGKKLRGRKQPKEIVDAQRKKWKDPEYKKKRLKQMLRFKRPNRPETKIISICEKFELPYTFVGNGELIIGGFNPDFVDTENKRLLIEIFGDYWHNRPDWAKRDEQRFKIFSKNGYKTLVLWEHEIVSRKNKPPKYSEEQIRDIILNKGNYR